jgi:hypothetical protein
MARGAVMDVAEQMADWQSRMSAHLRRRCIRRAGKTAFSGWREALVGSRRQRRMLVKGAATWVKAKLRRTLATWRKYATLFRRQTNILRRATLRLANRRGCTS